MLLAIDFDGTIVEHCYPFIGEPIPDAIDTIKKLQEDGHRIILWTCREDKELAMAIEFCESNGIYFESYNHNTIECFGQRKVLADFYIDDRNIGGLPDWKTIYKILSSFNRKKVEKCA